MKPLKIACLILMCAVAQKACCSALITPYFLKLNFSLIVQQQALLDTNKNNDGKTYVSTIDKMKVNNKAFLTFLGEMFETNWPAGAQLEYDMGNRQLIVADKSGTNVLFYCADGVSNANRYAYVDLTFLDQLGPYSGKSVEGTNSSGSFTGYWQGTITIHYENFSDESVYTDFSGMGLNIEDYSAKETLSSNRVSQKETFTPFAIGTASGVAAVLTGKIKARGKTTTAGPV